MVDPGGAFSSLGGDGSAVDHLQNLSDRLDDLSLVHLVGTCHALRDGPFSRTAATALEPAEQVLCVAVNARLAARVRRLEQKLDDTDLMDLLHSPGLIDWRVVDELDADDISLIAGLCVMRPTAIRAMAIRLPLESVVGLNEGVRGFLPLAELLNGAQTLDLSRRGLGVLSSHFVAKCLRFNSTMLELKCASICSIASSPNSHDASLAVWPTTSSVA